VDLTDKFYTPYTSETMTADMLAGWWSTARSTALSSAIPPARKYGVTGYVQSYHFRYVGKDAAAVIMDNGLCLEEFTGALQMTLFWGEKADLSPQKNTCNSLYAVLLY
jgi:hypothetical protein